MDGRCKDSSQAQEVTQGHAFSKNVLQQIPRPLAGDALRDDFIELYSPPRLAPIMKAKGYRSELSIDLSTGYDLTDPTVCRDVMILLEHRRPKILMISCPCTAFSKWQDLTSILHNSHVTSNYFHGSHNTPNFPIMLSARTSTSTSGRAVFGKLSWLWAGCTCILRWGVQSASSAQILPSVMNTLVMPEAGKMQLFKRCAKCLGCSLLLSTSVCLALCQRLTRCRT